jgi:hypothetical protein
MRNIRLHGWRTRPLLAAAIVLVTGAVLAAQLRPATIVTRSPTGQYKDSFYFVDNGVKYLAVSDLTRGGVSLLRSYNGSDTDYRFYKNVVGGNNWAPTVVNLGNGVFTFVTTEFAFNNSYLNVFRYNVRTGGRTTAISRINLSGGERGMTDATIWYEPGKGWYLIGAKWQEGVLGCRLQWGRGNSAEGPFSFPVDLYDSPNGNRRVDWGYRGSQVDYVVEAPVWSFWDHNRDGFHELYWSIGPSDPKNNGVCTNFVKAVRRGDINWKGNTPWIYVWGPSGGDGDMMSNNMDCYHLTHPDFTQNGNIRATSMKNGRFVIVNLGTY